MSTYCTAAPGHEWHGPYHDTEYGFPLTGDNALFERLILEINQAGLSWLTILKKRAAFRRAYNHFDVATVASYRAADRRRLLADPGIVRNRLKVDAAIANAKTVLQLRDRYGSFADWLAAHHPRSKEAWVKLFKDTFRFTGGEITGEFLMSIGYLPGAHAPDCPVYARIVERGPPWMSAGRRGSGAARQSEAGQRGSGAAGRDVVLRRKKAHAKKHKAATKARRKK